MSHTPVLLCEVVQAFDKASLPTFLDGTLGAGGHAEAILKAHPEIETFYGIDRDESALSIAKERLKAWGDKLQLIHSPFTSIPPVPLGGILLDLGVSSMQFDQAKRGFSIQHPGPLDMRMDSRSSLTAADIVNTWSERELGEIFRNYGEERRWRAAARAIVRAREIQPILTTDELTSLLFPVVKEYKSRKTIHPLTLIFQALRIAVNDELMLLEQAMRIAVDSLAKGGRLAIITFHSLEDRLVKNYFRYIASDKEDSRGICGVFRDKEPLVKCITRKPIICSAQESQSNPRARSAKLRVVERI